MSTVVLGSSCIFTIFPEIGSGQLTSPDSGSITILTNEGLFLGSPKPELDRKSPNMANKNDC